MAVSDPPSRPRLPGVEGIWVFLGFDAIVFGLLFLSFQSSRHADPQLFDQARTTLDRTLGGLDTLVLLTSSWLVARAVQASRDTPDRVGRLLLGGALTGAGFVASKAVEYAQKLHAGLNPRFDPFYQWYFVLTGVHLAHVVAGTGLLTWCLRRARRRDCPTVLLECVASFWHLVDLLWIVLFPLLYLQR